MPQSAIAGWAFAAPAGTTITAATLDRDLYKAFENGWVLSIADEPGGVVPNQNCWIDVLAAFDCETAGILDLTNLNAKSIAISVTCGTNGCRTGFDAHWVRADLDHAVVTLSDPSPPATPAPSGPLTQPGWHTGTIGFNVSSSDAVGIGQFQVTRSDGVGLGSTTEPCDYTYTVPCPTSPTATVPIDTTRLPDGIDTVTVSATDAAQNTTSTTIQAMVANRPPPAPTLTGVPTGPTSQTSLPITAHAATAGVPISAVDWILCSPACGQPTPVPVKDSTASFVVNAPTPGSYTLKAYAVDAAGHASATVAQAFTVNPPNAPASLPSGQNATVTLPPAVGHGGVRLLLTVRRRSHARIELAIRTSPRRTGTVDVGLTFSGHRRTSHVLHLRRGLAVVLARVPHGATRLTIAVRGVGTATTRRVSLT